MAGEEPRCRTERLVGEGDGDTLKGRRTTTSGEDLEHLGLYEQIDVQ